MWQTAQVQRKLPPTAGRSKCSPRATINPHEMERNALIQLGGSFVCSCNTAALAGAAEARRGAGASPTVARVHAGRWATTGESQPTTQLSGLPSCACS